MNFIWREKLFKYMLQLIIGIFILAVSTFIAWYEGSAIIENSLEWKYSTPFTELFNIDITKPANSCQLFLIKILKYHVILNLCLPNNRPNIVFGKLWST